MGPDRRGVVAWCRQTRMIRYLWHPNFLQSTHRSATWLPSSRLVVCKIKVVFGRERVPGVICHGLFQLCIASNIAECFAMTRKSCLDRRGACRLAGGTRTTHLNGSTYRHLSQYLLRGNLPLPACDRIHSLSCSD